MRNFQPFILRKTGVTHDQILVVPEGEQARLKNIRLTGVQPPRKTRFRGGVFFAFFRSFRLYVCASLCYNYVTHIILTFII